MVFFFSLLNFAFSYIRFVISVSDDIMYKLFQRSSLYPINFFLECLKILWIKFSRMVLKILKAFEMVE